MVPGICPAGQRLWLLPGLGQDRRRLFPGLPLLLEPGGVLSAGPSAAELALHEPDCALRPVDFRALSLPVSNPERKAEPPDQSPGSCLGRSSGVDPVVLAGQPVK